MEADRIRYAARPLAIAVFFVLALELAARFLPLGPLAATGVVRLLDILLIIGIAWVFKEDAGLPGIIPVSLKIGFARGALWSAGFGGVAILMGAALYLSGINPLTLIRVGLPGGWEQTLLFLAVAGVIGPVAEELFFRGVVYGFFRRWGVLTAVVGSTLLFVGAHHFRGGIPVPQAVGGLVFALSYETEKNLLVPVSIHITGNLALFTLSILF